jgi:hypothetical protein
VLALGWIAHGLSAATWAAAGGRSPASGAAWQGHFVAAPPEAARGRLIMAKPFTTEARLRAQATLQARAYAFARSMADTIAALEREGITSNTRMAKALNERGIATFRFRRWETRSVINLRRRLKQLGL